MANTKTKIQLRDSGHSLSGEMEHYLDWSWYFDWDDYEYCGYNCSCQACCQIDYEYLPDNESNLIYISRFGRRYVSFSGEPKIGRMIDMNSIYSKEVLREKRIDSILGLNNDFPQKATLADIWKR